MTQLDMFSDLGIEQKAEAESASASVIQEKRVPVAIGTREPGHEVHQVTEYQYDLNGQHVLCKFCQGKMKTVISTALGIGPGLIWACEEDDWHRFWLNLDKDKKIGVWWCADGSNPICGPVPIPDWAQPKK